MLGLTFSDFFSSAANSLINPKKIIELTNSGVNVYDSLGVKSSILNKYANVDDGNWHHVVFLWSNDTGGNYIIDNLSQGTNTVMYSGHTFDDE